MAHCVGTWTFFYEEWKVLLSFNCDPFEEQHFFRTSVTMLLTLAEKNKSIEFSHKYVVEYPNIGLKYIFCNMKKKIVKMQLFEFYANFKHKKQYLRHCGQIFNICGHLEQCFIFLSSKFHKNLIVTTFLYHPTNCHSMILQVNLSKLGFKKPFLET